MTLESPLSENDILDSLGRSFFASSLVMTYGERSFVSTTCTSSSSPFTP